MDAFWWILLGGLLMSAIALVGGATLLLSERASARLILPLVALSAGTLLGGALFHLMPEAVGSTGADSAPWLWCAGGFSAFFVLERYLRWRHCQGPECGHREPRGWLILIADGLHNVVDGLAVGGAFVADARLGIVTWLVAAAHEIPQELGDFGILVHSGWPRGRALLFNFVSGLGFLVGGLVAWGVSSQIDVSGLLAFGAGSFVYIAAADLIPELARERHGGRAALHVGCFLLGLGLLIAVHLAAPHDHAHAGDDPHAHEVEGEIPTPGAEDCDCGPSF